MSLEKILLEETEQLYEVMDSVENELFKQLIESNLLTNSQYRTILLEAAQEEAELLMEANAGSVHLTNATKHSITVQPDNVTVTPEQFRQVWTDYDRYPTPNKIYMALGFPPNGVAMQQQLGTQKNHLGYRRGRKSLLQWYNQNNPNDQLALIQDRERVYSNAAKNARGGDDTEMYEPDGSRRHIDPGKRGRNSPKIQQLNNSEVVAGEFYNNITRLSPRRWSHWAKFWDQRISSVEPNKRKLLGSMIGKTWKKTFLLGYQVDRNSFYEVWYNSLDSTFAIYDKNGVQQSGDMVTLNEAIQNLIHILAQQGSTDKEVFLGATHGANLSRIAQSMGHVLSGDLSKEVGALKRERELMSKEASQSKEEQNKRREETNAIRRKKVDSTRERQATMAGLTKEEYVFIRRAEKAVKMYDKEIEKLEKTIAKYKRDGNLMGMQPARDMLQKAESNKQEAIDLIRLVRSKEAKIGRDGDIIPNEKVTPSMIAAISSKGMKKVSDGVSSAIKAASGSVGDVMQDLHRQKDEIDNIAKNKELEKKLQQDRDEIQRQIQKQIDKSKKHDIPREILEKQHELMSVLTAAHIAKSNASREDTLDWEDIDPSISKIRVANVQSIKDPNRRKKKWQTEATRLQEEADKIRQIINEMTRAHNKGDTDEVRALAKKMSSPKVMKENFEDIFADVGDEDSDKPAFDPQDRRVDRHFSQVKKAADNSPYTAMTIIQGVMGDTETYDVTKMKRPSALVNLPGVVGRFFRGRTAKVDSPMKGTFSRAKMAVMGDQYRADFIVGFTMSDRINIEIWYIMEPGENGKITTHYMVFDVNANKVIRSYLPYYRNAIQVVAAKMQLQT